MTRTTTTRRTLATLAVAALMASGLVATTASAAPNERANERAHAATECAGRSVPASKISIQLFSYSSWQGQIGVEGLIAELADIGFKNVEPFGASYGSYTRSEYRDLLADHGMKAPTAHGNVNEATWDATLADAKDLGQKWVGSGGFAPPGIARNGSSTYEDAIAVAETMNRLGERSVKAGTGKIFGHNHAWEFTTIVTDPTTGTEKSAWEVIVENTDRRWVTFQLDTFWAADAFAQLGSADPSGDVVDLLERYGNRIELLHIKDGDLNGTATGIPGNVGAGDMDWDRILKAAHGKVKLYILERDGAPANAEFAQESFDFLTCFTY